MELIKEKWDKENIPEFQQTLTAFENPLKREWAANLLKTELPVLCITTAVILRKHRYKWYADIQNHRF